jgi:hypothetical protein
MIDFYDLKENPAAGGKDGILCAAITSQRFVSRTPKKSLAMYAEIQDF